MTLTEAIEHAEALLPLDYTICINVNNARSTRRTWVALYDDEGNRVITVAPGERLNVEGPLEEVVCRVVEAARRMAHEGQQSIP